MFDNKIFNNSIINNNNYNDSDLNNYNNINNINILSKEISNINLIKDIKFLINKNINLCNFVIMISNNFFDNMNYLEIIREISIIKKSTILNDQDEIIYTINVIDIDIFNKLNNKYYPKIIQLPFLSLDKDSYYEFIIKFNDDDNEDNNNIDNLLNKFNNKISNLLLNKLLLTRDINKILVKYIGIDLNIEVYCQETNNNFSNCRSSSKRTIFENKLIPIKKNQSKLNIHLQNYLTTNIKKIIVIFFDKKDIFFNVDILNNIIIKTNNIKKIYNNNICKTINKYYTNYDINNNIYIINYNYDNCQLYLDDYDYDIDIEIDILPQIDSNLFLYINLEICE
jgi:hypothetical protein